MNTGAGERFVVARDLDSRQIRTHRRRDQCGHAAAQRIDGGPMAGMHAIGEQDHISLAERIDPDGSSGEAGVAVRADGEQFSAIGGKRRIDIPAQAA